MTSSIKKLKNSQVELLVDLNKEDLLSYAEETEKKLAQEVELKGFRAGKAPKEMIRKKVGEDKIREESLNLAVQSSLAAVLSEQKLNVIDQADFKILENSKDRLAYRVVLMIFPDVKLGGYKEWDIKRHAINVTDNDIDNVLQNLLKSRITLKEADRAARVGDSVEVDFTIKDKGSVIEGGRSENHPVILGEGKFLAGFEDQIAGMKSGENKNFSLKVPGDYYQKSIAGKDLDFEVAVKRVEDRIIPKLDDEFARSLGNFQNLGELRANVKKGLLIEKEEKEKDKFRQEILEKIISKTAVEIPEILVGRRLDAMIREFDGELHQRGMELGPYLAHLKKTEDDLKKDWRPRAEFQVKASLVIQTIAKEESLKVSEEEINNELQTVLQQFLIGKQGGGGSEALEDIDPAELKGKIHNLLLNEKVFDFLEKHNKISIEQ